MTDRASERTPDPGAGSPAHVANDLRAVLARLLRRLRESPAEHTLTPSQASALSRLSKGGVSTVSALARAENVRPQSMAATVDALEDRGFVSRSPDPSDGRRQIVDVTPGGWAQVEGQRRAAAAWLEDALAEEVSGDELATLSAATVILARIVE